MREYENENTLHNAIALAVSGDRNSLVVVMEGDDDSFLLKRCSMRSAFRASLSFAASVRFFAGTTMRASCIVTVEAPLTL